MRSVVANWAKGHGEQPAAAASHITSICCQPFMRSLELSVCAVPRCAVPRCAMLCVQVLEETGVVVSDCFFATAENTVFVDSNKHYVTIFVLATAPGVSWLICAIALVQWSS